MAWACCRVTQERLLFSYEGLESDKMNKDALLKELMQLSVEERLELVQDLWDSIPDQDFPPLSEEQMAELDRRLAEHESNPESALPWEEVKAHLWSRYK
jgi:putative addiction module component (TIGR02574 family)